MIVPVFNRKGGVGKTTLAVHLAQAWRADGMIDLDEQQATRLFRTSLKFPIARDLSWLDEAPKGLYVVDCPPDLDKSAPALALAQEQGSFLVLPMDTAYMGLATTVELTDKMRDLFPFLRIRIVLTMLVPNHPLSREARDGSREAWGRAWKGASCGVIQAAIPKAVGVVGQATKKGLTVFDYAPESSVAAQFRRVAEELRVEITQKTEV